MTVGDLPAGRSLDALIAEKVMGHEILSVEEMLEEARQVWKEQPKCRVFMRGFEALKSDDCVSVRQIFKPYSTSIAAAWEVVEKLKSDFLWLERKDDLWTCCLWSGPENGGQCCERSGETVSLAIVRAALKAVEAPPST